MNLENIDKRPEPERFIRKNKIDNLPDNDKKDITRNKIELQNDNKSISNIEKILDNNKMVEKSKKEKGVFTSERAKKTVSYSINSNTIEKLNQLKTYWLKQDIDNYTQYTIGFVIHKIVKLSTKIIIDNKEKPNYLTNLFAIRERSNLKPKSFFITNREEFENDLTLARQLLKEYTKIELDKTKAIASFINGLYDEIIISK